MNNKTKLQFRILISVGILLVVMLLMGQTMAVINYDFAVSIELQEPVEEMTEVGVAMNKGFGLGDTVIYLPLLIVGIIGLIKRKFWGFYTMSGAMAITAYWPIVCLSTILFAEGAQGFHYKDFTSVSIILALITIYGLWSLWYLFRHREVLVDDE